MDVKLSPKYAQMSLDSSLMTLNLPVINLYVEEEKVSQNEKIIIFKKDKKKSSSEELF